MESKLLKTKKGDVMQSTSTRGYPATIGGKVHYVSIPGAAPKLPGPESEMQLRSFLIESIEAGAELQDIVHPAFERVPSDAALARDAGMTDDEVGFVVGFGGRRYMIRISQVEE